MRHHEALLQRGRKYPAAGVHLQPDRPNIVFLTVTTEKRKAWLANETGHQLLRQVWLEATAWLVGDYLLMPDHLHCFCAPRDPTITIEQWITFWKREFRRDHGRQDWRFQSRGWHHRLRNDENYVEKWNYVQLNPVRRGLVKCPGEWPYQGRIHAIG
jgi:putative transposase